MTARPIKAEGRGGGELFSDVILDVLKADGKYSDK